LALKTEWKQNTTANSQRKGVPSSWSSYSKTTRTREQTTIFRSDERKVGYKVHSSAMNRGKRKQSG